MNFKYLISAILLLCITPAIGQKNVPEYKASNGVTYHVGDTAKLGRGTGNNGKFVYIMETGLAASDGADGLPRGYSGGNAVIKKVVEIKRKGAISYALIVGVGLLTNYGILVEDAIATCELTPCKDSSVASGDDKFDKLKKLKDLLDSGAITQEEYDAEKKKILQ